MKKRLLMLLSIFMTITSVGWMQAQETTGTISAELEKAQTGQEVVFGIITKQGNVPANTMVRVALKAKDNAFDGWKSYFYEPSKSEWIEWNSENDGFGSAEGFAFQDATSYIKVIPQTAGTYEYTLTVTKVDGNTVLLEKTQTLVVTDAAVSPMAKIGETYYASLPTAVHFAGKDADIKLTAGEFNLSEQLVIDKPLSLTGVVQDDGKPTTIIQAKADAIWPEYNSKKNLISIQGKATGVVTLNGIYVSFSKASGINAQSTMETKLIDVALTENTNAGLLVHSKVEATRLLTFKNGWGGVNVDGTLSSSPLFKFDADSFFGEQSKIWSEDTTTDPNTLVGIPIGWISYVGVQGTSSKEMRYWTNSKLTFESVTNFYTDKTLNKGYTLIYANGNPITVEASGTDKVKISAGTNDVLEIEAAKNPIIFGGSKFKDVESSSIDMKSGKVHMLIGGGYLGNVKNASVTVSGGEIVNLLVGGGYGPSQAFKEAGRETADVTNATVKIQKAKVYYLISGGLMYAKTKAVNVEISDNTQLTYILGGGYAPAGIGQSEQTDFATIANGVETTNFKMTGGKVSSALFVGGGYSYSYSKNVTAILNNVECAALLGTGSNGRSDNVKVEATNCKFVKATNWPVEIAAINRGKVGAVSLDFKSCTFPVESETKYIYLGATYQWQTGSFPIPTADNISFTFDDCINTPVVGISEGIQNVVLNGAAANVASFSQKSGTEIKDFTIPKGNVWTLNNGLTIADGCTLTNNGTLNVPASSIMSAIEVGGALVVDAASTAVVEAMNKATSKTDLSSKTFSIECKDGVIASNETVAKELLKAGKVVMLLSFSETYSVSPFQKTLAKITNLPDSVVFGTQPITLAFNLPGTEVTLAEGSANDVVEIKGNILTINKPGTVTLNLKVKNNDVIKTEYDADAASTQTLKVTKRKVTLTAGLKATDKAYDGKNTITLTKEALTFSGKLGTSATGLDLAASPKGELTDANVGDNKEVIVTAALAAASDLDSTAYYELAPITFVKAKVTPKAIMVTAEAKSREYGKENPEFTVADYSNNLISGDKLDGILKFNCEATKESKAAEYDIMPYGLTSDNYKITFAKGALTVSAVNPVIEMVEAKTVLKADNSAKEIQLKAKLIHAGGAKAITSVKFVQQSADVTATLGDDGFYTGKFDATSGTTYSVKASATAGSNTGESKAISIVVDALTPQVVSFGKSVLPTMVYGNEMTLSATSDQAGATGEYTYSVEGGLATIADGKLTATGAGKVTLTVTRAADATHSAAVATQTIEITPKPITVAVGAITKVYDGTTTIATLPTFTLTGASNDVSVNTAALTLSFASKNVSENVKVLMPELTLTGTGAANYTLVQPTSVTGKITKAPLSVRVKDVTRMWNQRYTKYEFEADGLKNSETLSAAYTGAFTVKEDAASLNLTVDAAKCPNYDITAVAGKLTVELGTPKAVVYGTSTSKNAMIVDEAGYTGLKEPVVGDDGYANIQDANGKVIGRSLNKLDITTTIKSSVETKAAVAGNWNVEDFKGIPYGTPYEVTKLGDGTWTYESTNANVLTVSIDGTSGNIICTPVATGKATILAISTAEVKILNIEVTPTELTIETAGMDKTYDGTTLATGTLTLTGADGKDVALDLSGVTFNFADKKAGEGKAITPSQPLILIGSAANNYHLKGELTGKISQKEVTVGTISAYYNGKTVVELTDYASNDRISGDIVPVKVTFGAATAGEQNVTLAMGTTGDAANYKLAGSVQPTKGNILKSTIVATLPEGASSTSNLKSNIKLAIRETGETVTSSAIGFEPTVTSEGSGSSAVYYVNGGETDNYSVVYDKNQLGFKSEQSGGGGSTDPEVVAVSSVSLDKATLDLPRLESYTLKATINPTDATNKSVTWKSSDESIATVDANGKVTAVKVGTATITVTTADGGKTATCEVTVDFATGLEEALANTEVYGRKGNIYVNPIQPLQLTIVNMIGKVVYNERISSSVQVPLTKGIYIVKLTNAGNTIVSKVSVQ